MHPLRFLWLPVAFAVLASACGPSEPSLPLEDAGSDAGEQADAGPADAGPADAGPIALAPGDVAELTLLSGAKAGASLATPNGNEKFAIVVASTRFDSSADGLDYSVALSGAPEGASAKVVTGCSLGVDPWRTTPLPPETPPSGTPVTQGTTKTLNVPTPNGFEAISAEAIAVGNSAVVWADKTAAHPANLDLTFVNQFLTDFENVILPRQRTVFGMESDLDGDGHIALVFTPLTKQIGVAFFNGCDLVNLAGCQGTNRGEYLYLTPPAAIAPPYNTPNAIKEILTHECSHLIHFNRKVLKNGLARWPDSSYMVEGTGGFAQDAIGPQAGNLHVAKAGLDGIQQFSLADTLRDGTQYDTTRNGVLRGGSYLFVRYLYDRAGGDLANADGSITSQGGPALMRSLLGAPQSVATALPVVTGAAIQDIATDFYTTLAMSNRDVSGGVAPTNPCFAYLPATKDPFWNRQRGADLFAKFSGGMMQMTGPAMQKAASVDGKLRVGGVEYVDLDATSGKPRLDLTVTVDPTAQARVRIGRLR